MHYHLDSPTLGNPNLLSKTHINEVTATYPTSNYQDKFSFKTDILNGTTYTLSFEAKSTHAGD